MNIKSKLILLLGLFAIGNSLSAEYGFQVAVTPNIALAKRGEPVNGVALNIWGENQVKGLDLGLVNGLNGKSSGFSWSLIGTYGDDYSGVLWGGFYVKTTGVVVGWQDGLLNINTGNLTGFQSGLVNIGNEVKGLQLGLINYTKRLEGLQIGLVNVAQNNAWFYNLPSELTPIFPFVNWSF